MIGAAAALAVALFSLVGVLLGAAGGSAASQPPTAEIADQLDRLTGHQVVVSADGADFVITDAAGEGPAMIGTVTLADEADEQLWLLAVNGDRWRLTGPLAIPRIAGPGYKVWVVGEVVHKVLAGEGVFRPRRLGILRSPHR